MAGKSSKTLIKQMVARIVEKFDPDRVILFGSHARGDATSDSDVDLLVVLPYKGPRRDLQVKMRMALNDFHLPKDVIVTTPHDFEERRRIPGTIERPASIEGKVLYARR